MTKKKILLAWELGGGLGHVSRLVMLARHFIEQNCEVMLVVRHLSHVPSVLQDIQCLTLQAPISLATPQPRRESISFADILWECGYFSSKELFGLVAGWQSIFDLVHPDFLLADFAPTALLAARLYDFKTAWLGGGFLSPPAITPWPDFQPAKNAPLQLLRERETAVLETVNTVLQAMGGTPLKQLANLFDTNQSFLCTWPELDCYDRPADTRYWGPCITPDYGQETAWPHPVGKGIFCYLKSYQPQAGPVLNALRSLDIPTLTYVENLPPEWEQQYGTAKLQFAKAHYVFSGLEPRRSDIVRRTLKWQWLQHGNIFAKFDRRRALL